MKCRPGWTRSAPARSLKRLTEVLSATITSPDLAPTNRAILSPMRVGASIQWAAFQLRISPLPHSFAITSVRRGNVLGGGGARGVALEGNHPPGGAQPPPG